MVSTSVSLVGIESGLLDFVRYIRIVDSNDKEVAIISLETHFDCISISINFLGRQLGRRVVESWRKSIPTDELIIKSINELLTENGFSPEEAQCLN